MESSRTYHWRLFVFLLIMTIALAMASSRMWPAPPLDMKFSYTLEEGINHLDSLGSEGVAQCLTALGADMVYPLLYASCFGLCLWLLATSCRLEDWWELLWVLPCIGAILDWGENIFLYRVLNQWPRVDRESLWWAGHFFTPAKWTTAGISLLVIVVLLICLGARKLAKR